MFELAGHIWVSPPEERCFTHLVRVPKGAKVPALFTKARASRCGFPVAGATSDGLADLTWVCARCVDVVEMALRRAANAVVKEQWRGMDAAARDVAKAAKKAEAPPSVKIDVPSFDYDH